MPGVFVIQGWHPAAAIVVEQVVAAEDARAARGRARDLELIMVTVRPYAPVQPPDPLELGGSDRSPGPHDADGA